MKILMNAFHDIDESCGNGAQVYGGLLCRHFVHQSQEIALHSFNDDEMEASRCTHSRDIQGHVWNHRFMKFL